MTDIAFNMLCMACGEPTALTEEQAETIAGCPRCGDTGLPADLDDSLNITITAHELRILTFWADGYARLARQNGWDPENRMPGVLKVIRDRLGMQTETPLSLSQEMADLRQHFSDKFDGEVDFVLFDSTGCLECGAEFADPTDALEHRCGMEFNDERTEEDDTDTQPPSSS